MITQEQDDNQWKPVEVTPSQPEEGDNPASDNKVRYVYDPVTRPHLPTCDDIDILLATNAAKDFIAAKERVNLAAAGKADEMKGFPYNSEKIGVAQSKLDRELGWFLKMQENLRPFIENGLLEKAGYGHLKDDTLYFNKYGFPDENLIPANLLEEARVEASNLRWRIRKLEKEHGGSGAYFYFPWEKRRRELADYRKNQV